MGHDEPRQDDHRQATELGDGERRRRVLDFSLLRPGRLFADRYRIRARLGTGGAGEVWEAEDTLAGATVALKVLFPRGDDAGRALDRLRRELSIFRKLRYPGIVTLHDVGESAGLLYLVFERLQGTTLRDDLRERGRLTVQETVELLRDVLRSLAVAHECGVVHRDIKPGNVFLAEDGDGGRRRVVLLDFGLARSGMDQALTVTGAILGTPEYMSPEQARGATEIGPASDLYSVGIVGWEMLGGAPPLSGDSMQEILAAHLTGQVPDPRRRLPGCPPWLGDLLGQLLEKDPASRPADAAAALAALTAKRRAGPARRLRRGLRRSWAGRRWRWIVGAAATLVLGAAGMAAWFLPRDVVFDGGNARVLNVAGRVLRTADTGFLVTDSLPLHDSRLGAADRLVSIDGVETAGGSIAAKGIDAELFRLYPHGLARFDPFSGRLSPFLLIADRRWRSGVPSWFENFTRFIDAGQLTAVPWTDTHGRHLIAVVLSYIGHYPAECVIFDESGYVHHRVFNPGSVAVVGIYAPDEVARRRLVLVGLNNELGERAAWIGVDMNFDSLSAGHTVVPPYRWATRSRVRPAYYGFLSDYRNLQATIDGDTVELRGPGGIDFRIDAATGVPLSDAGRGGLSLEEWTRDQGLLLGALERSGRLESLGRPTEAAEAIETALRAMDGAAATQRGVLFGRAAELRQEAGDLDRAMAHAEEASRLEPLVPGHVRRRIDLLARGDGADALPELLAGVPSEVLLNEVRRDALIAELLRDDRAAARRLLDSFVASSNDYYPAFYGGILLLHEGDPAGALARMAAQPNALLAPEMMHFEALAAALRDRPDFTQARAILAATEPGIGNGNVVPFVSLLAWMAACEGSAPVPDERLLGALEAHRDAARANLVDLYFAEWARELALAARPDLAGAIDAIFDGPGPIGQRGPFVDLLALPLAPAPGTSTRRTPSLSD